MPAPSHPSTTTSSSPSPSPSPSPTDTLSSLSTLSSVPPSTLSRIAHHVLSLPPDGTLTPSPHTQLAALTLSRTSAALRHATAAAIRAVHFPPPARFWPGASALSPHIWPTLRSLEVSIDRSVLLGFLKWLLPAISLHTLRLRVTGTPYANNGLPRLERLLVGRLLTQVGQGLRVLDVEGLASRGVLFGALFQCAQLRELRVMKQRGGAQGKAEQEDGDGVELQMWTLACMANAETLENVCGVGTAGEGLDGNRLWKGCMAAWESLWGSFRAGLKESAVNLRGAEEELVRRFQQVSVRMDAVGAQMKGRLEGMGERAGEWGAEEDVPERMLFDMIPQLRCVNETGRP